MVVNGWLNFNKPEGVTSAHLLNRLKRCFPKGTKLGHAGTLDKFACGVLPVAVGNATKTIPLIMNAQKTYTFTIQWGVQTDTLDREGDIVARSSIIPSEQEVRDLLPMFLGALQQIPPTFSALKMNGKRASDRARSGEVVDLVAREIHIFDFQLLQHHNTTSTFQVTCSKGTYVRALARDLAHALNTTGYVDYLRRDRVGQFFLDRTILLENDLQIDHNAKTKVASAVIPIRTVLDDIPAVSCTELAIARISKGQRTPVNLPDMDVVFAIDDTDVIATGYVNDRFFLSEKCIY